MFIAVIICRISLYRSGNQKVLYGPPESQARTNRKTTLMIVFRADHKVLTSESEILAPATSYSRRRQVRSRLPASVHTPRRATTRIGEILQTKSKNSIGPLTPIRTIRQRQNLESAGD